MAPGQSTTSQAVVSKSQLNDQSQVVQLQLMRLRPAWRRT